MITKKWIMENGEGHWELTLGDYSMSCDANEVEETARELMEIAGMEAA